jgi:epoxyqueuosine reductase
LFGCDVCQDVCPWNRKRAATSPLVEFAPREGFLHPDVEAWREMTPEEFVVQFAGSPVLRAKHAGFVRNLALVGMRGTP